MRPGEPVLQSRGTAPARRGQRPQRRLDAAECRLHAFDHQAALLRRPHAVRRPFEQAGAKLPLQLGQALRECGLRKPYGA